MMTAAQQPPGAAAERVAFQTWLVALTFETLGSDSMEWAAWKARAALVGPQPPAERVGGDPAEPRDDSDRVFDDPVGYLPAYELRRLHSGHDGRLRSAKFGPSELDGDIPVYLQPSEPPVEQPAPLSDEQADEIARQAFDRHSWRLGKWEGAQPWVIAAIKDAAHGISAPAQGGE